MPHTYFPCLSCRREYCKSFWKPWQPSNHLFVCCPTSTSVLCVSLSLSLLPRFCCLSSLFTQASLCWTISCPGTFSFSFSPGWRCPIPRLGPSSSRRLSLSSCLSISLVCTLSSSCCPLVCLFPFSYLCVGQGISYLKICFGKASFSGVEEFTLSMHLRKQTICVLLRHFDLNNICVSLQILRHSCPLYISPMLSSWRVSVSMW